MNMLGKARLGGLNQGCKHYRIVKCVFREELMGVTSEKWGLVVDKATENNLLGWEPVCPCMIWAWLNSKLVKTTVRTSRPRVRKTKEEFHEILQQQIKQCLSSLSFHCYARYPCKGRRNELIIQKVHGPKRHGWKEYKKRILFRPL